MDGLRELLNDLQQHNYARANLLGMLNVFIGRQISAADGTLLAPGLTWRVLADLLKKVHWDPEAVRELGLDPEALPPRDRQRFWYQAIARAGVDSEQAAKAGNRFARVLRSAGYVVSSGPQRKNEGQRRR